MELNLQTVDFGLERQALKAWNKGNVSGVLICMSNTSCLAFVFDNMQVLKEKEKYEEALLDAYVGTRTNWHFWSLDVLEMMFTVADSEKLAQAGDPIPDRQLFTLYRGVGGNGKARRVTGFSWTSSLDKAIWFAKRAKLFGLNDPAVFTVTVPRENVLAYCNERDEHEYLLRLPLLAKPKRVKAITFEGKEEDWVDQSEVLSNLLNLCEKRQ